MTQDETFKAAKLMEQIGGGFMSALAKAWVKADNANKAKLEKAFQEDFEEYLRLSGLERY